jgi:hypothetical protein
VLPPEEPSVTPPPEPTVVPPAAPPAPEETTPVANVPAEPPVSVVQAIVSQLGLGGGSVLGPLPSDDNPFNPYFENNISPQNLAYILAYFGLGERFAAIPDDGQVDIVWLEFERQPSLKGLTVMIDGIERTPDLSAAAGKLVVLIFRNQSTLTRDSDVVAVFGKDDGAAADKATRRPLR